MSMDSIIKQIMAAMPQQPKTSAYDTQATVRRIEDGVAWVHIPGGVDETPVKLTVDAKQGDTVQVRVSGGRAFLVGNATAPPTDDTKANKVASNLTATQKVVKAVKATAEKASRIATSTAQYFWVSTGGNDNGAHITAIPQEEFEADPQNGGGNTLMTTNGVAVRDGLTELATFGANGSVIGTSSGAAIEQTASSINFLVNGTRKARITVQNSGSVAFSYVVDEQQAYGVRDIVYRGNGASGATTFCFEDYTVSQGETLIYGNNISLFTKSKVQISRNAPIVKETFSETGLSASTYYISHTFNITKTGYTPIALNVRTNQAAVVPASAQFDGSVTVMSRNSSISNLNLYLDVTYARNELL